MKASCSLKDALKEVRSVNTINDNIKRFEVYYIELPENDGSVQSGLRPCVIVSNNKCNQFSPTITIVPITSQNKKYLPTHVEIMAKRKSTVLCEQVMLVSKDLICDKSNIVISKNKQNAICKALKIQLGL